MRRGTNKGWSLDRLVCVCVRGRGASLPLLPAESPPGLELPPPRRARAADGLGRQPSRRTRGCSRMLVVRLPLRRDEEERILSTFRRGTRRSCSSCRSSGRGFPSSSPPRNLRRPGSRGEGSPEENGEAGRQESPNRLGGAWQPVCSSRWRSIPWSRSLPDRTSNAAVSSWRKGGGGNGDSGLAFSLRPALFRGIVLWEPTDENPPCRTACCCLCDD